MNRKLHILGHVVLGLAAIAGFGAIVMLLWNALVPPIFGITVINFWQTLGLLILLAGLSKFMVISAFLGMRGYKHNPIREKWQKMTPEEREEFIRHHHHHRHSGHGFGHFNPDFFNKEGKSGKKD
jgi:ABC-type nickel/cobalt efflux system permease component RcnA